MSNPTVKISIAFVNNPWDASPTWVDVSADYIAHSIHRGRQHELARFEAGTASILLLNTSGDYWSSNSGSPYYGDLDIKKRIKIEAVYNSTTYPRFVGYIEKWTPDWLSDKGGLVPVMRLECADAFSHIARYALNTSYSSEGSGVRFGHILDSIGFPAADRTVDTGKVSVQASTLTNGNALDHLYKVDETEFGQAYIGDDGKANFENRSHRTLSPHNTSQHTFSDAFADIELALDDPLLFNDIRLTRSGGSEQTASDSSSQTAYGKHSLVRSGLLHTSDVITGIYSQYMLARYKQPALRAKSMTLHPEISPSTLFPIVLDYEISTRITVGVAEAGLSADYFIEGIDESFDSRSNLWETKFQLSDATQYLFTPAEVTQTIRVNDATIGDNNDATKYSYSSGSYYDFTAALDDIDASSISNVTVYVRASKETSGSAQRARTVIISGATTDYGTESGAAVYPSITQINKSYALDPNTGAAWTNAALNALVAGASVKGDVAGPYNVYANEAWITVTYIPAW